MQDLVNNSTPLCYSKNNRRFVNYSCMKLLKRTPSYSMLDSALSNLTLIHQFYYSASTPLRTPTFSIRLDDKSRVKIPLRQYLVWTFLLNLFFLFCSFFDSVYFLFSLRSLIAFFHVSKTLVVSGITFNVPSFKKLITFFFTFCSLSFFPLSSHYRVCQNNGLLWVKTKFLLKIVKGSIFDFIAFGFSLN